MAIYNNDPTKIKMFNLLSAKRNQYLIALQIVSLDLASLLPAVPLVACAHGASLCSADSDRGKGRQDLSDRGQTNI